MGSPISKDVMTEEETVTVARGLRPSLTLADRCDRCGAQAFASSHHGTHGSLLFCGHHFAKHEAGLIGAGFEIQDERHRINEKPSVSANAQ